MDIFTIDGLIHMLTELKRSENIRGNELVTVTDINFPNINQISDYVNTSVIERNNGKKSSRIVRIFDRKEEKHEPD